MYLQSLELKDFRNFTARKFDFSPEVNIIHGPNASGKTNLLEAVYVLSNLRSFRTRSLRDAIRWDQSEAYLRGIVQTDARKPLLDEHGHASVDIPSNRGASGRTLAVKIEPKSRTAFLQAKLCRSSKEYLQALPSTAFIPDDLELVKGMPAARRFFLDRGTFQFYPPYWSLLTDYNKALHQKNALLRQLKDERRKHAQKRTAVSGDTEPEAPGHIWDEQLQQIGSHVMLQRMRFVHALQHCVERIYTRWLHNTETLDLRYKASTRVDPGTITALLTAADTPQSEVFEYLVQAYGEAIQRNRDREYRLGTTVIGPHRDDLNIHLLGRSLRSFGSQGQQRTAVLALKIAEVLLYVERYQEYSILLLDDVTSELDDSRTERLFEYVQHGMQVFISTTSKPDLPVDRSLACAYFDLSA